MGLRNRGGQMTRRMDLGHGPPICEMRLAIRGLTGDDGLEDEEGGS
jgi:hypothetical protein